MAEIVNLSVFTNDGLACNSADLLQQAFQDVVDDVDGDTDIVAFFEDESGQHQSIRLTQEQVAALGLTFEVDSFSGQQSSDISCVNDNQRVSIIFACYILSVYSI